MDNIFWPWASLLIIEIILKQTWWNLVDSPRTIFQSKGIFMFHGDVVELGRHASLRGLSSQEGGSSNLPIPTQKMVRGEPPRHLGKGSGKREFSRGGIIQTEGFEGGTLVPTGA